MSTAELVRISRKLAKATDAMRFAAPVAHVYNPLIYARAPHELYLSRYGAGPKEVLFLGMNPGPFGMAQTGVPFGEVSMVRDWLGIEGPVSQPPRVHPKRPIEGFACKRSEVSGARLWGWAKSRFASPEAFFNRFFVVNYCPLVFMDAGGKNVTPDKLTSGERDALEALCDTALRATTIALGAKCVIGVGAYAEERARAALTDTGVQVGRVLHPSPASPAANRGWASQAERDLERVGVRLP
jgi:single-strand selective monofunctional uracil DNA glycosylase